MTRINLGTWKDSKGEPVHAILEVQEQKAGWFISKARRSRKKQCSLGFGLITVKVAAPIFADEVAK